MFQFARFKVSYTVTLGPGEAESFALPEVTPGQIVVHIVKPDTPNNPTIPTPPHALPDDKVEMKLVYDDKVVKSALGTKNYLPGLTGNSTGRDALWSVTIKNTRQVANAAPSDQRTYRIFVTYPSASPIFKRKIPLSFFQRAFDEFWNNYKPIEKIKIDYNHDDIVDAYTLESVIKVYTGENDSFFSNVDLKLGMQHIIPKYKTDLKALSDLLKQLGSTGSQSEKERIEKISVKDKERFLEMILKHQLAQKVRGEKLFDDLSKMLNTRKSQKVYFFLKEELAKMYKGGLPLIDKSGGEYKIGIKLPTIEKSVLRAEITDLNTTQIKLQVTDKPGVQLNVSFESAGKEIRVVETVGKDEKIASFNFNNTTLDVQLLLRYDPIENKIPQFPQPVSFGKIIFDCMAAFNTSSNIKVDYNFGTYNATEAVEKAIPKAVRDKIMSKIEPFHQQIALKLLGDNYPILSFKSVNKEIIVEYAAKPGSEKLFLSVPIVYKPAGNLSKIDHIVVLMMENRSFDQMLGYLRKDEGRTDVNGLTGQEFNEYKGKKFPVYKLANTKIEQSPCHEAECVSRQMEKKMAGFVSDFARRYENDLVETPGGLIPADLSQVMGYYGKEHVYTYDYIAREFAICDKWFCAHPGPTWPNRFLLYSGKLNTDSDGKIEIDNPGFGAFSTLETPTIFDYLSLYQISWKVFEYGYSFIRLFTHYTFDTQNVLYAEDPNKGFFAAAKAGKLPSVTFIEPDYIDVPPGNDDHPPADILDGQQFVGRVVQALIDSPQWKKTMLVITYDEHGGFFDHVTPPGVGEPPSRAHLPYGPRVPALVVSPWVAAKSVCHDTFDHTSVLATIVRRFFPPNLSIDLGPRVPKVNDLGNLLSLVIPRNVTAKLNLPAHRSTRTLLAPKPRLPKIDEGDFHELLFATRLLMGYPPK